MCLTGLFLSLTCKRRPSGMEKRSFVKLEDFLKHYVLSLSLKSPFHHSEKKINWTQIYFPHSLTVYTILLLLLLLLLLSRFSRVQLCATSPGKKLEWVAISFSNAWKWKEKVKSLSHVQLLATPRTAAYQASLPMGFSKQCLLFLGNIKLIIEWVFLQSSKESNLNCLYWNHVFLLFLKERRCICCFSMFYKLCLFYSEL